ncbi:MAG: hypothetical protein ACI4NZ_03370, partial [Candidatus Enterousia sp.]
VYNCVAEAGTDKIKDIMKQLGKTPQTNDNRVTDIIFRPNISIGDLKQLSISRSYSSNRTPSIDFSAICDETGKCTLKKLNAINDFYSEIYNTSNTRSGQWNEDGLYVALSDEDSTCTAPENSGKGTPAPNTGSINCIYDNCHEKCSGTSEDIDDADCYICRITEQIWGNCESYPKTSLTADKSHNRILQPKDDKTTLLWWFAQNTGTSNELDSCRDTTCPAGYQSAFIADNETNARIWTCGANKDLSIESELCGESTYKVTNTVQNCCPKDYYDWFYNCLLSAPKVIQATEQPDFKTNTVSIEGKTLYLPETYTVVATWEWTTAATAPCGNDNGKCKYPAGKYALICAGADETTGAKYTSDYAANGYPSGQIITCNGKYIVVNLFDNQDQEKGLYFTPGNPEAQTNKIDASDANGNPCHYSLKTDGKWVKTNEPNEKCAIDPQNWKVDITY